ncbi:Pyruvate/Phosphoenolpyruvate kinase-like domain [Phytophthora cactorum]|nr:Pyruvate/Phosphoenolpyruvate kinase-like domain [Phytophthora cactorum]
MAHIGLRPQHISVLGGFRAKDAQYAAAQARSIIEDAFSSSEGRRHLALWSSMTSWVCSSIRITRSLSRSSANDSWWGSRFRVGLEDYRDDVESGRFSSRRTLHTREEEKSLHATLGSSVHNSLAVRHDDHERRQPRGLDDDEPPMLGEVEAPANDNQVEHATENQDASIMDEMLAVAQRAKEDKRKQQDKERNRKSFGQGLKKGFFNTTKTATKKKKTTPEKSTTTLEPARQKSRDERLLIVKQEKEEPATDNSTFVFPEVQEAMKSMNQLDPKEWMNQRFFDKLAQNPKLAYVPERSRRVHHAARFHGVPRKPLRGAGRFTDAASSQKKSGPQQQQDSQPLEGLQ